VTAATTGLLDQRFPVPGST